MKVDRIAVHQKYGGHCAYCGAVITVKEMQVDHIWPQARSHWQKDLDPNRPENLNPSCRACNYAKHTYNIELFRSEMQKQVLRLSSNYNFKMAMKYNQISVTEKPILFYYERT